MKKAFEKGGIGNAYGYMKRYTHLIIVFFLTFCLSCARGREESLNVVMGLAESEWKVMREEIFPLFEQEYGCTITFFQAEAGDWIRKLEAMVKGKNVTIDVFSQDNMQLAPLVKKELVEDLTEYRERIPPEIPSEMKRSGEFLGKTYFFPYRPNAQITYYDEEKFKKYGLEVPRTWDELLHVAKVFKEREMIGKVGLKLWGGNPTSTQLFGMIISAGGDPFTFNDAGCVKTFTFLQNLYPYLSPDSKRAKWDTTITYLSNGSFYLAQNWPFSTNIIVEKYKKKTIQSYHGWRGPAREAHTVGGEVLGIPKGAKKKELALEFILFLESRRVQRILLSKLGWPPARDDVYADISDWRKPYFESVKRALKEGVYRPNVLYWGEFNKYLNEAVTRIVLQGAEVQPVLDEYHEKMEHAIDAYER